MCRIKIVQIHNSYLKPGGEDIVLDLERDVLLAHGHQVERFVVTNKEINVGRIKDAFKTGLQTIWSSGAYSRLYSFIKIVRPDLIHVHNTFPLLSPSVYWAAASLGVPVALTLHNYRLICANALLMRDSRPCEMCVGRYPLPSLKYRCYRDSIVTTGVVVSMQIIHRILKTYNYKISAFITLNKFSRSLMVRAGLPVSRVYVKPNFVPDPKKFYSHHQRKYKMIYVGRLSFEKGMDLLLEAWMLLKQQGYQLTIVGDGPELEPLKARFSKQEEIEWKGWLSREAVLNEVAESRYLVIASRCYEGFPMVLLEAFALGTPVIVPNHAGFPEIVTDGINGWLFSPNDVRDLQRVLDKAINLDTKKWEKMSVEARKLYESRYSPEPNYKMLMSIYNKAIETNRRSAL